METPEPTPTTPTTPEAPPEPERTPPPDQNLLGESERKRKKAERESADKDKRIQDLEDRDRSESEKVQRRAEEAEKRAQEAEDKNLKLERGSWVRQAAQAADFHDPDDAVVRANISDIESQREAQKFVEGLAKDKAHLVKPKDDVPPQIGRVLQGGERTTVSRDNPAANFQQQEVERAESLAAALKKVAESNTLQ